MWSSGHRRLGPPHGPGQLPGHAEPCKAGLEEGADRPRRDRPGHPPATPCPSGTPAGQLFSGGKPHNETQRPPPAKPPTPRATASHCRSLTRLAAERAPLRPWRKEPPCHIPHEGPRSLGLHSLVTGASSPLRAVPSATGSPSRCHSCLSPCQAPCPRPSHTPTPLSPTEVRRCQGHGGPWGESRPLCREGL